MPLNRRFAVVVVGLASGLALCTAASLMSPRSAAASIWMRENGGEIAGQSEVTRIRTHFDSVFRELGDHGITSVTTPRRYARLALVNTLRAYSARGVCAHNYDFADGRPRTLSIARRGRCAPSPICWSRLAVGTSSIA